MQDDVSAVVKDAILDALNGQVFQQRNVQSWIDNIGDNAMKGLKALNENFKLVVSCFISEKKRGLVFVRALHLFGTKKPTVAVLLNGRTRRFSVLSRYSVQLCNVLLNRKASGLCC